MTGSKVRQWLHNKGLEAVPDLEHRSIGVYRQTEKLLHIPMDLVLTWQTEDEAIEYYKEHLPVKG